MSYLTIIKANIKQYKSHPLPSHDIPFQMPKLPFQIPNSLFKCHEFSDYYKSHPIPLTQTLDLM